MVRSRSLPAILALALTVLAPNASAQGNTTLRSTRLSELAGQLLGLGEARRLTPPSDTVPGSVILYQLPNEGYCVPATHYVCSIQYAVLLVGVGEAPPTALYYLGEVGEITSVKWLASPLEAQGHELAATLEVCVASFPAGALEANPELSMSFAGYRLLVSFEDLRIDPVALPTCGV